MMGPSDSHFRWGGRALLFAALCLLVTWGSGCGESSDQPQTEVEQLRSQVEALRARVAALEGTQTEETPQKQEEVESLLRDLREGDVAARYHAARDLVEMDTRALPPLLRAVKSDDGTLRRAALMILAKIADPRAVPAIASIARGARDKTEKGLAVMALGRIGGPEAENTVLDVLGSGPKEVRVVAVQALVEMDSQKAVPRLVALLTENDDVIPAAAKRALEDICDDEFPGVMDIYQSSDTATRVRLVDLLSGLHNEDARAGLELGLQDQNLVLQLLAGRALAERDQFEGVPVAQAHLNDDNPRVSHMAMTVLKAAGYTVHFDRESGEYTFSRPGGAKQ